MGATTQQSIGDMMALGTWLVPFAVLDNLPRKTAKDHSTLEYNKILGTSLTRFLLTVGIE